MPPKSTPPRVLILHNRYRIEGGEERSVGLQLRALRRAGIEHALLERSSDAVPRGRAGAALVRGGDRPGDVERAVRDLGADVVHAHNLHPLLGARALRAARESGARVVAHLHNARLFCAIGLPFRDGADCYRCRRGRTLPGLALNCRGSLPEAAAYAVGLRRQLPMLLETVDRFVAPSRHAIAQLVHLGLPADRIELLEHYLPDECFAERSRADGGEFALVAGRLVEGKGVETGVEAAAIAGVPLRVAGEGPLAARLAERAARLGAPVALLGRADPATVSSLRARAAMALLPSLYHEFAPYSALEAMAAGTPVVATRAGALPELVGEEKCVPRGDARALADALARLWGDPDRRRAEGDALIAQARERFGERRFVDDLLDLYSRVRA